MTPSLVGTNVTLFVVNATANITEPNAGMNSSVVTLCFSAQVDQTLTGNVIFRLFENIYTTTASLSSDFSLSSQLLTIPGGFVGTFTECINFLIIGDNDIEADEVIDYAVIPMSTADSVVYPDDSQSLVINILDNDGKFLFLNKISASQV